MELPRVASLARFAGVVLFGLRIWGGEFPEFVPDREREYLGDLARTVEREFGREPQVLLAVARAQVGWGDQAGAERLVLHVIKLDAGRAEAHSLLSDLLIRRDRLKEAGIHLEECVRVDSGFPGAERRLGMVLHRLGERDKARAAFERAIGGQPKDPLAHLSLGQMLLEERELESALLHLEKACELNPGSANSLYLVAQAQTRLGQAAAAAATLERFRALKGKEAAELVKPEAHPRRDSQVGALAVNLHLELAEAFNATRQNARAKEHLLQAIRILPREPAARRNLVGLLINSGELHAARAALEDWVKVLPEDPEARRALGSVLLQLKDPGGVEHLERVLIGNPNDSQALQNLARFYLGSRQNPGEALRLARRLVEAEPDARNYDLLAWAYYANHRLEEARKASTRSTELDPGNATYTERRRKLMQAP